MLCFQKQKVHYIKEEASSKAKKSYHVREEALSKVKNWTVNYAARSPNRSHTGQHSDSTEFAGRTEYAHDIKTRLNKS